MNEPVLQARQVSARRGLDWLIEGFALFRRNSLIWIVLILMYLLIAAIILQANVIGLILFNLVAPVFIAGLMIGCRALENNEELEIRHLFSGFQHHAPQLITVGGLYVAGLIIVFGVMFAGLDENTLEIIKSGKELSQEEAEAFFDGGFLFARFLGLLLLIPLIMAYWYAPPLAAFHGLPGFKAMKLSLQACLRNILPLILYGFIATVVMGMVSILMQTQATAILALIILLIITPIGIASLYVSYKDVFAPSMATQEAAAEEE